VIRVVDWSNYGKKTEFTAPGVSILSTGPGDVKRQVKKRKLLRKAGWLTILSG
jgi:hypothetical protein